MRLHLLSSHSRVGLSFNFRPLSFRSLHASFGSLSFGASLQLGSRCRLSGDFGSGFGLCGSLFRNGLLLHFRGHLALLDFDFLPSQLFGASDLLLPLDFRLLLLVGNFDLVDLSLHFFHASIGDRVFGRCFPIRSLSIRCFHSAVIGQRNIGQSRRLSIFRFGNAGQRKIGGQFLKDNAQQQVHQQADNDRRLQPLHDDISSQPPRRQHHQPQPHRPANLASSFPGAGQDGNRFTHRLSRSHAEKR